MEVQKQDNTAIPLLNNSLKEVEKSISNIVSAIEQGIFTTSTKARLEKLENQKHDLEIQIAQEKLTYTPLTRKELLFWFHRFRKMDVTLPENRRRLVDSFVNSIILYDDRIEFYFNFRKGAASLTLKELKKGSDLLDSTQP